MTSTMTNALRLAAYGDFLRAADRFYACLDVLDPSQEADVALARDHAKAVRDAMVTVELVAPGALVATARDLVAALSDLREAITARRGRRRTDGSHARLMRSKVVALFRRDLGTSDNLANP